jgi:hypothetical protein
VIELNSTTIANERAHPVYVGSEASFRAGRFGVGGGGSPGCRWGHARRLRNQDEGHDGLDSDRDQDGGSTE